MSADAAMRRATRHDVPRIARLFAAAFARDPVFDWLVRDGDARLSALQRFFGWILESRTVPHGETWVTADGMAATGGKGRVDPRLSSSVTSRRNVSSLASASRSRVLVAWPAPSSMWVSRF